MKVDNVRYRWTVIIQRFDSSGALLTFFAHEEPPCDPSSRRPKGKTQPKLLSATLHEKHCETVTPGIAATLIRAALARGWDPKGARDHVIGERAAIRALCL